MNSTAKKNNVLVTIYNVTFTKNVHFDLISFLHNDMLIKSYRDKTNTNKLNLYYGNYKIIIIQYNYKTYNDSPK